MGRRPDQNFSKEGTQVANRMPMKRCSALLMIKEMQIKTTMSYPLTMVRMVIINNSINSKSCRRCGEKGTLWHCWWEYKLIHPLWSTVPQKKLQLEFPYDQAFPLPGMFSCCCLLVTPSGPTLCDPRDYSLPGSSVHGILQGRMLEWVAILFFRGSSWPRDQTWVSCTVGRFFTVWTTRKAWHISGQN